MSHKRLEDRERKQQILAAALTLAANPGGLNALRRNTVAAAAGCSDGLVSMHFGTMSNFRRAVVREAVRTQNLPVIAQALAAGDTAALKAPDNLKAEAIASLSR